MDPRLDSKWRKLEDSRTELLKKLKMATTEKLERSVDGQWSVAQIFYHLNQAEKLSILYVGKKMQDVKNLGKPGFKQSLRLWYTKFLFRSGKKFKAPEHVLGKVPDHVAYNSIVVEWDHTRVNMWKLLSTFPSNLIDKNVFKQPAIGRLSLPQMLDFMQMHFDKHSKQIIDRI